MIRGLCQQNLVATPINLKISISFNNKVHDVNIEYILFSLNFDQAFAKSG